MPKDVLGLIAVSCMVLLLGLSLPLGLADLVRDLAPATVALLCKLGGISLLVVGLIGLVHVGHPASTVLILLGIGLAFWPALTAMPQ